MNKTLHCLSVTLITLGVLLNGLAADARSHSSGGTGYHHVRSYTKKDGTYVHEHWAKNPSHTHHAATATHHSPSTSREHRSAATRSAFQREHPCPSTGKTSGACPGYIKDHIVPLCKGGPDVPSNMQWQTVSEAKAKDRVECR